MKLTFTPLLARLLTLGLIGAGSTVFAGVASAQSIADKAVTGPTVQGRAEEKAAPLAPADAIPGASSSGKAAPAKRGATDMSPNDTLFDAINRGDIAAARDAINRGADFTARNVLGLTPLDESIDLSRNDITFLLLSLRGATPGVGAYGPLTTAQAAKLNGKQGTQVASQQASKTPASRPAAPVAAPAQRPISNASLSASAPAVAQYPAPRPGSGGTPNPQSGFLGFGG